MAKKYNALFKYTDATLEYLRLDDDKLACLSYFGYGWDSLGAVFKCGEDEVLVSQAKKMSLVQLFEFLSIRSEF